MSLRSIWLMIPNDAISAGLWCVCPALALQTPGFEESCARSTDQSIGPPTRSVHSDGDTQLEGGGTEYAR